VPAPCLDSTNPVLARARIASRTVERPTPSSAARVASEGGRVPTGHAPLVTWSRSRSIA
jgi:hypothetical protein